MLNEICLILAVRGVVELVAGIRILLYVPLSLFARLLSKPIQIGYTRQELDELLPSIGNESEY